MKHWLLDTLSRFAAYLAVYKGEIAFSAILALVAYVRNLMLDVDDGHGVLSKPIPFWLVVAALVAVWIAGAVLRRLRAAPRVPQPVSQDLPAAAPQTDKPPFSTLEGALFEALVALDGAWMDMRDVPGIVPAPRLRIEEALEGLARKGLIEPHQDAIGRPMIGLSRAGRQFAIENGYVRDWNP